MLLPKLPYTNGAARVPVPGFYGLDRRAGAGNGAICDMLNLTGAEVPVLATRPGRQTLAAITKPHGLISAGALVMACGTALTADGVTVAAVSDTDKVFAALGERVVVFPDKLLLRPAAAAEQAGTPGAA